MNEGTEKIGIQLILKNDVFDGLHRDFLLVDLILKLFVQKNWTRKSRRNLWIFSSILGKAKDSKLEVVFGEEIASELHSSTEELSFHENEDAEKNRSKKPSSHVVSVSTSALQSKLSFLINNLMEIGRFASPVCCFLS